MDIKKLNLKNLIKFFAKNIEQELYMYGFFLRDHESDYILLIQKGIIYSCCFDGLERFIYICMYIFNKNIIYNKKKYTAAICLCLS